jgi:hypothetical protein
VDWKEKSDGTDFKVVCTWCGVIIRRAEAKDSQGMCLKCYARMLGDRGGARERDDRPRQSSDR